MAALVEPIFLEVMRMNDFFLHRFNRPAHSLGRYVINRLGRGLLQVQILLEQLFYLS
jgi:hypothetical protein